METHHSYGQCMVVEKYPSAFAGKITDQVDAAYVV